MACRRQEKRGIPFGNSLNPAFDRKGSGFERYNSRRRRVRQKMKMSVDEDALASLQQNSRRYMLTLSRRQTPKNQMKTIFFSLDGTNISALFGLGRPLSLGLEKASLKRGKLSVR